MGGMQALEWAVSYPEVVRCDHSDRHHVAAQRAADRIQRSGPAGDHGRSRLVRRRLLRQEAAGARAVGGAHGGPHHLHERRIDAREVRTPLREKEKFGFDFGVDFEVESYLRYRGNQFVSRFDANSYLYITKAEDYFDLTNGTGRLSDAFRRADTRFLVISFTSDWLYPSYQSQEIVRVLRRMNGDVAYCDLQSNYGHDAFLVDIAEQTEIVRGFLDSTARMAKAA
jgi:homoserine O-acetyltransferase